MSEKVEFDGLPYGVTIKIGDIFLVGTKIDNPEEEKESA
jgi:hypothetical protein